MHFIIIVMYFPSCYCFILISMKNSNFIIIIAITITITIIMEWVTIINKVMMVIF